MVSAEQHISQQVKCKVKVRYFFFFFFCINKSYLHLPKSLENNHKAAKMLL